MSNKDQLHDIANMDLNVDELTEEFKDSVNDVKKEEVYTFIQEYGIVGDPDGVVEGLFVYYAYRDWYMNRKRKWKVSGKSYEFPKLIGRINFYREFEKYYPMYVKYNQHLNIHYFMLDESLFDLSFKRRRKIKGLMRRYNMRRKYTKK